MLDQLLNEIKEEEKLKENCYPCWLLKRFKVHLRYYLSDPYRVYIDIRVFFHDLFFPHNVVKIKALSRSWHDRDQVLFHANFQILCDFIELEMPFGETITEESMKKNLSFALEFFTEEDIQYMREGINTGNELIDLYSWYKKHVRIQNLFGDDLIKYYSKEQPELILEAIDRSKKEYKGIEIIKPNDHNTALYSLDEVIREEEDKKLHQLINLRKYLWT